MAGVSRNKSDPHYKIAVKQHTSSTPFYSFDSQYHPMAVAISQSNSLIAYTDNNLSISVINITSNTSIFRGTTLQQSKHVQFIGEDKLLIQQEFSFFVYDLFLNSEQSEAINHFQQIQEIYKGKTSNISYADIAVSPDRTLLAIIVNRFRV